MKTERDAIDLKQYAGVVWKWMWLIVLMASVAAVSSYLYTRSEPPTYQAKTTIMVGRFLNDPDPTQSDFGASQQLAQTYGALARRAPVLQGALHALDLGDRVDWRALAGDVRVNLVSGTQLLEVYVEDSDPQQAKSLADAIVQQLILQSSTNPDSTLQLRRIFSAEQLVDLEEKTKQATADLGELQAELDTELDAGRIGELQSQIGIIQSRVSTWQSSYAQLLTFLQGGDVNYLTVVEPALVPATPISPNMTTNVVLSVGAAVSLAVSVAFLIEYLDDTVKLPEDVERAASLPTLGAIVRIDGSQMEKMPIAAQSPRAPVVEAYRALRTNLQFATMGSAARTLMVTSPQPIEGKTTTVANLAVVMAQSGLNTIAVDTDLRRPMLHHKFGLFPVGLTSALLEMSTNPDPARSPLSFAQDTGVENLRVIASGTSPPNPADLLGSGQMKQFIQTLREEADVILFDTPPALAVTDAAVLAAQVDGIVLVVNAGQTRRTMLKRAVEELQRSGTPVLGVVINRMTARTGGSYYYDYYRRYYASDDGESDDTGPDEPRRALFGRLLGRLFARSRADHRSDSIEDADETEPRSRPKRIRRPHLPDPFQRDPK